jgi:hypothetical protein
MKLAEIVFDDDDDDDDNNNNNNNNQWLYNPCKSLGRLTPVS